MINLATHHVYISFQCSGVDKRDRGLGHAEEAMLDVSATYGTDLISLRKRAPEQHLDGIGDCVDGDVSTASLFLGGEVRFKDPSVERRRSDVLHDQIRAAGPIAEDVIDSGNAEV